MQIPGYKIERLMAEGGMSSVYLAMQESLGRRVALKLLKRFDSPQHAGRFLHEARVIAALQHRNIITIHDVGTLGDRHYIAMEYLEGGSLADRIDAWNAACRSTPSAVQNCPLPGIRAPQGHRSP